MFCMNCSSNMSNRHFFYQPCDTKVKQAPETKLFQNQQLSDTSLRNGEVILGVFPAIRKVNLIRSETWIMVFTNRRLLVAIITFDMRKKAMKDKKGILQKIGAMGSLTDRKRFYEMMPDQILLENAGNFVIEYHQIEKMKLKKSATSYDYQTSTEHTRKPILKMEYSGQKVKILLGNRIKTDCEYEDEFIDLMIKILDQRFSYKK